MRPGRVPAPGGVRKLRNEEGAAFCASTLIRMHDAPIDIMNYYDGQAMTWFCGLYDYYGVPTRTFAAFRAFQELLAYPGRVAASSGVAGVDVLAARAADGRGGALLIANFGAHEGRTTIGTSGLAAPTSAPVIRLIDRDHALQPLSALASGANAFVAGQNHLDKGPVARAAGTDQLELLLRRHAVVLVRWDNATHGPGATRPPLHDRPETNRFRPGTKPTPEAT